MYYSSSVDHFRGVESGVSGSRDGFWMSLGLLLLEPFSGMKMAYRKGGWGVGGVPVTKENTGFGRALTESNH